MVACFLAHLETVSRYELTGAADSECRCRYGGEDLFARDRGVCTVYFLRRRAPRERQRDLVLMESLTTYQKWLLLCL